MSAVKRSTSKIVTPLVIATELADEFGVPFKSIRGGYLAPCLCHKDKNPSLSLRPGLRVPVLIHCFAGCKAGDLIAALKDRGLWSTRTKNIDIFQEFPYHNAEGKLVLLKSKAIQRADGENTYRAGHYNAEGKFVERRPAGERIPLYRLKDIIASPNGAIFVVEGEKDADSLAAVGLVATTNFDGAAKWRDYDTQYLKGLDVVILTDNDEPGKKRGPMVSRKIHKVVKSLKILELPGLKAGGDISNWLEAGGTKEELEKLVEECPLWEADWEVGLVCYENGKPKNLEKNYALYLRNHPNFQDQIRFDEFKCQVLIRGKVTSDALDTQIICEMQDLDFLTTRDRVTQAISMVAEENSFDSLAEYVMGLKWDGVPRIGTWLQDYMGARGQRDDYLSLVGIRWLVSGIARALEPGCKSDQWIIFEGAQGKKKSSGLEFLVPDEQWFQNNVPEVGKNHKDAVIAITGKWIIEVAELKAVKKADREAAKAFASTRMDMIRLPYGKHLTSTKRRCVIAGTHNPEGDDGYFTDPTGARRWLPVSVGEVKAEAIKQDRDQLWAEALEYYKKGEPWWLEPEEVGVLEEQRKRFKSSEIVDEAFSYLEYRPVIIDSMNPLNIEVKWVERDEPLTVFIPKYFWADRFGQDWIRASWAIKQDVNGAFQNAGWEKVNRRFPEEAKAHEDPVNRRLRAWVLPTEGLSDQTHQSDTCIEENGQKQTIPLDINEVEGKNEEGCRSLISNANILGKESAKKPATPPFSGNEEGISRLHLNDAENGVCNASVTDDKSLISTINNTISYTTTLILVNIYRDRDSSGIEGICIHTFTRNKVLKNRCPECTVYHSPSEGLKVVADFLSRGGVFGLDFETTSLSPRTGKVRLLQISDGEEVFVVDLDLFGGLSALKEVLEGREFVAWNAKFEKSWLRDAGIECLVDDAMLAFSAMLGGVMSLKDAARDYLNVEMDKAAQKSDWSGELTDEQIKYAALDALLVHYLWGFAVKEMKKRSVEGGYLTLIDAVDAVVEMERSGMAFDCESHSRMIEGWEEERERYSAELLSFELPIENWDSPTQVQKWLSDFLLESGGEYSALFPLWPKTPKGKLSVGEPAIKRMLGKAPEDLKELLEIYTRRQHVTTLLKSFGEALQDKVVEGRVYGSLSIGAAKTGRMTSSKPNLQNMPSSEGFRELFVAETGNKIVVADYSQIEVRVGGLLADEPVLAEIFAAGKDVHTSSAAMMFRKDEGEVTKGERKKSKALTFAMQYGMGQRSLAELLKVSEGEAGDLIERWKRTYPRMSAWRDQSATDGLVDKQLRTVGGRRIRLADKPSPSVCYNYPVQGSAADVMYKALACLYREVRDREGWKLLSVVHDEVVMEVPEDQADEACKVLEAAMVEGYLELFEGADTVGLVDAVAGDNWAVK